MYQLPIWDSTSSVYDSHTGIHLLIKLEREGFCVTVTSTTEGSITKRIGYVVFETEADAVLFKLTYI